MADFVIADVTDTVMDGYIDGFPNTYASKVGSVRSYTCVVAMLNSFA